MKKRFLLYFCILILSLESDLFAQISLLNPVKGKWSNKQMLVIDTSIEGDYFYSIDGSDPSVFGFAYDGPVLLDVEGDVTLKVTKVTSRKKQENLTVNYTVVPDEAYSTSYYDFISSFFDSGLINYTAGSVLTIPSDLYYSLGLPPDSFIKGQPLQTSEHSVLARTIPCTVKDNLTKKQWRFIIKTYPLAAGTFSRRDLPVKVTDWETLEFLDENLIYKVDSEYWELPKTPKTLDRSVSHMISWQNLAYEYGNPVEFIVLPPKPEPLLSEGEDGELRLTLKGDPSYKMSVLTEDSTYQELFDEIGFDVFYGDKVSSSLKIGIFSNGLYQGQMDIPYQINKRPPAIPQITSSVEDFYTREDVTLQIETDEEGQLYYAVSEPFSVNGNIYNADSEVFQQIECDNFIAAKGNKIEFQLTGLKDSGVYYKIRAYSSIGANDSEVSEYSVIIDQYNYYYDSFYTKDDSNGTAEHPFNNFEDLLKSVNLSRSVGLNINGELFIPSGKNILQSNCLITGNKESSITFDSDAQLIVTDSTLEIRGLNIKNLKDEKSTKIVPLFKGERSILIFDDCLVYGNFEKNGTIIDAVDSFVYIDHSICAVTSFTYSSFISGVNSKINIKNSNISSFAETSVLISASGGEVNCNANSFRVNGKTGRIAELFGASGNFNDNVFKGELSKTTNSVMPVFADKISVLNLLQNENYGF